MMRIIFWILVAVGLCAFFFAASHQNTMTLDENTLFWGSIGFGIMAIMAGFAAFMLFNCWKKQIAIMIGYYGSPRVYPRDSQPFRYWSVMLFYLVWFLFNSFVVCAVGIRVLLPLLLNQTH
jgi:hypothetical protein